MDRSGKGQRPLLHSIMTAYRPIEEYWASHGPTAAMGDDPTLAISPLDASLFRLSLDLLPGRPVMIDAATRSTGGASGVLGLTHPRVSRVVSATSGESQAKSALRLYAEGRERDGERPLTPLEFLGPDGLASHLCGRSCVAILADARGPSAAALAEDVGHWLAESPAALVFVLGLGRLGECPAIDALCRLRADGQGPRLRLFREHGEVLAASGLGLVDSGLGAAVDILPRVEAMFTGNFAILDMLKTINQAAMRTSEVEADRERLMDEVQHWQIQADRPLLSVRRKLSAGRSGRVWRAFKARWRRGL